MENNYCLYIHKNKINNKVLLKDGITEKVIKIAQDFIMLFKNMVGIILNILYFFLIYLYLRQIA